MTADDQPKNPPPAPSPFPTPVAIGPSPMWVMVVGAVFGGITLLILFGYALLAGLGYLKFCDGGSGFRLLAGGFALGCALSAGFLGGGAAAQGTFGNTAQNKSLAFSLTGGVAVLIIAFLAFLEFKPDSDNCAKAARLNLEFHGVPADFSPYVDAFFSRQDNDNGPELAHMFKVQIPDEATFGRFAFYKGGVRLCVLPLFSYSAAQVKDFGPDAVRVFKSSESGNPIKFDYVGPTEPKAGIEKIKAGAEACFKSQSDNHKIFGAGAILQSDNFFYLKTPIPNSEEASDTSFTDHFANRQNGPGAWSFGSVFSRAVYSIVESALAQNASITPFSELKVTLKNPDPSVRISARHYFEQHFSSYASDAVKDLFAGSQPPLYLENLLYGLIEGINAADGGALVPEKARNLGSPLPYVSGREAKLVALTADPSESVQKQARRLIQRFPVDAFDPIYSKFLSVASQDCNLGRDKDSAQSILYGSIFYEYNRIEQNIYVTPTDSIAQDAEARAKAIRDMVAEGCLDRSLAVDAASVDYARALMYSKWSGYSAKAKAAAKLFLSEVESDEDEYYQAPHIAMMKQLAAN